MNFLFRAFFMSKSNAASSGDVMSISVNCHPDIGVPPGLRFTVVDLSFSFPLIRSTVEGFDRFGARVPGSSSGGQMRTALSTSLSSDLWNIGGAGHVKMGVGGSGGGAGIDGGGGGGDGARGAMAAFFSCFSTKPSTCLSRDTILF